MPKAAQAAVIRNAMQKLTLLKNEEHLFIATIEINL